MLVKLKMKPIYKSFLSLIGFLLVIMMSIGTLYIIFYDKMHKESDVEVNGFLSVNYNEGKNFEIDDRESFSFTIVNGSEDIMYYDISLKNTNCSSSYTLYSESEEIASGKLKLGDKTILSNIGINGKETKTYKITIKNTSKKDVLKGKIDISTIQTVVKTFAETIKENSKPVEASLTKPGVELATTDEGLIKETDDNGVTYYFRGASTNNYVYFANLTWRIVRINGDNTIRIVLDGITDNVSTIYTEGDSSFDYETSKIQEYLSTWMSDNLNDYESFLSNNKFCNDINHDEANTYQSYTRLNVNHIPTFSCLGTKYSSNIGLLSADEVILAGALINSANNSYYLYNPAIETEYFTMTGVSGTGTSINMFMVDPNGGLTKDTVGSLYRSVRPVINIIKNVEATGTGTSLDPYKLVEK